MFVETQTLFLLMPEIFLIALATWMIIGGTFAPNRTWWSAFAVASYMVAGLALYRHGLRFDEAFATGEALPPSGPIAVDFLAQIMRWLALVAGMLVTLMASHGARKAVACEMLGLIMFATTGVMLVSASSELVMMFLGLELISIPTYVLLFIGRPGREAAEATAKYFFLSILSSGLLLYGFSFLYGIAGTTTLFGDGTVRGIRDVLLQPTDTGLALMAPLALVLIFAGLGFKMAAVPFHFYAPDVYQGTTNANAGLLAVLPKIAGAMALIRLTVVTMPAFAGLAWQLALVIAILTMTIGNVCALWQTNVRRMMAYSSIANAGYMLIGLAVALVASSMNASDLETGYGGIAALAFYLIVYTFGTLGTFAVLAHLSTDEREVGTLDELAGLNKSRPIAAGLIAVFMFSLAGIPPLAGFWGKLTLFTSALGVSTYVGDTQIGYWFIALAIAGALNAAIAAAYYLRVVSALYFRPSTTALAGNGRVGGLGAAVICALVIVLVGVMPGRLLIGTRFAERSALKVPTAVPAIAVEATTPAAVASK
ncbi:MAG TPA: NADH-quinone oxidoreductase subunit N [Pirellulaceae bacterium]|nr:NADH-quinone oxidoreductase subunit N [Pirellulaceae bacterium]